MVLLPLVKGVTEDERNICYNCFRRLGLKQYAYYCTQFFLYGNKFSELRERIFSIVNEIEPQSLFLIGLHSPDYLKQMPPEVDAAAGQQKWMKEILRADNPEDVSSWKKKLENAMKESQTTLRSILRTSGGDAHGRRKQLTDFE